ncbi:MAG: penicillin-binding transpeptidase domain-containing protein [Candidatus Komeilibacteria bacterium]|nr:penicillin-binding transpeptidase domain-containing protein [Candidatus Komeilibacteria bacterium]
MPWIKWWNKNISPRAPHFVFYVRDWLASQLGSQMVDEGGLKIITTLDYDLQKKAEEIIKTQGESNQKDWDASSAALVALDNKTGQILSMVGSRDFFDDTIDGQVNAAIAPRQPGSSFKPIVYTEAWLKGYRPESLIFDLETDFPVINQPLYHPKNYDLKEHGPVSLRQALAGSLNIPAVKLLYLVGTESVLDLAQNLGYTTLTDRSRFGLSLVLGGGEVTLLEHTNAFATLARDGIFLPTTPVLTVTDAKGNHLLNFSQDELFPKKVLEPEITQITSDVLSDNNARSFIFGAQNYLTLPDRPVATKTGTTNNYHDAWTMGYTPSYSVGVWIGNNKNQAMKKGADGSKIAAPIWQGVFKELVKDKPVEGFTKPSYTLPNKPMLNGVLGEKVKIERTTGLLATSSTPPELIDEKVFTQVHDILQYINKDDPLGPIPTNPQADPYYELWEKPVQIWAEKAGYINAAPPTDYEAIHQTQDQPKVTIISPQENQTIASLALPISFTVQAPRGQARGRVLVDNFLIKDFTTETSLTVNLPPTITQGTHQLIIYIYDPLGNRGQASLPLSFSGDNFFSLSWTNQYAEGLASTSFPLDLSLTTGSRDKIKKIDLYWKLASAPDYIWLATTSGTRINQGVLKITLLFSIAELASRYTNSFGYFLVLTPPAEPH